MFIVICLAAVGLLVSYTILAIVGRGQAAQKLLELVPMVAAAIPAIVAAIPKSKSNKKSKKKRGKHDSL